MMRSRFKAVVIIMCCCLSFSLAAWGQSHFVYIQSNSGTPFYVKMNDSLLSSTHSGYLILPGLQKGTYPLIIGFAKKKTPEAAFKITVGDSGDKGFILKDFNGALQLVNIQNKQVLEPAEVATSAGNRILPSTVDKVMHTEDEQKTENEEPLMALKSGTTPPAAGKEQEKPKESENQATSFEEMLNAVTGGKTAAPAASAKETTQAQESEAVLQKNVAKNDIEQSKAEAPETEKKEPLSFSDLIHQDKTKASPVAVIGEPIETMPEKEQTTSPDLTFIDFNDKNKKDPQSNINATEIDSPVADTLITSAKELRQREKEKRRAERRAKQAAKKSAFDEWLETDSVSSNPSASVSVANPLFSVNKKEEKEDTETTEANAGGTVICNGEADQAYYEKVRRKIAAKKSEESMLRTAERYFSGDKCYSAAQIKNLSYLFGSDEYRFQFLKAAYLHCSDKARFGSLVNTLSDQAYQKRLKAFIR